MKRLFVSALAALVLSSSAFAASQPPLRPLSVAVDNGTKTATATSGAATLNKSAGVITTEALTTATAGTYVLTLTNSAIAAADQVFASVYMGTSTTGLPDVTSTKPAAGSVIITIQNAGTAVFNGTLKVSFVVFKN